MPCYCDWSDRRWNPNTGLCETCQGSYKDCSGKLGHEVSDTLDEATFLKEYKKEEYPKPSVTVDIVIFTVIDSDLKVLLIQRKGHPFKGFWAIPGGFVDVGDGYQKQGESSLEAANRELAEETGLPIGSCFLEQLYTFAEPNRDPRTRVISIAHYALVPSNLMVFVHAGDDAAQAQWFPVSELNSLDLAFDHGKILQMAINRIQGKIDYAPIAFSLVPQTFTVAELRAVYEAVKGDKYDPSNFRRRFHRMLQDGVILPATGKRTTNGRSAQVYRFKA